MLDFLSAVKYNIFSGRQKGGGDMKATKIGRPPSENPKNERITIRLDSADATILKKYCEQNGVDKAEAIRRGIRKLGQ